LFELASGGTLFLDEIAHLALPLQGKLLRALEERSVRRVGGTRTIPVDVRIIAATHVNMAAAVQHGEFREDLYYRLNVVPIELPPLRARRDDILPLARHFLARFAAEYGIARAGLTPSAERALLDRSWPGNVRELRNVMERALLLAREPTLDAADVASEMPAGRQEGPLPFPATLGEIVRAAAAAMLDHCGGNKSDAARRLGISRPRLQRILDSTSHSGDDAEELHV
jgi:DNA-binding NtrC family response regulator